MLRNAELNIMPENGWRFMVVSITPVPEIDRFHSPLSTDTAYLGSRAVEAGVRQAALSVPEDDRFVEVVPFPSETIRGTHNDILMRTKEIIREQVVKTQEEGRGLILGFSAWGGQQPLDVRDLIGFTRKVSNDRAVCIVGGPGFSIQSLQLESDIFAAGADIINLGGGKELAEWLGQLTKDDLFGRDPKGKLIAPIPKRAPFFSSSSKSLDVGVGSDPSVPVYYDPTSKTISVVLPQSGCVNKCDFCAVAVSLVRPRAPENEDLAEQVNAIIRKANASVNRSAAEEPVCLHIENPNPTQGQGLERLKDFLSKIDMTEPMILVHFLDVLSFQTTKNMERHLAYIEELLTKHEKLRIQVGISIDALQEEDDGNFIGRRIAGRLVRQDEYDAILQNYHSFVGEISKKEWANRLLIALNQISHPAMTADIYKLKLGLMNEEVHGFARACPEYLLIPCEGTPLSEKHKGHFAPISYMEKDWELGYDMPGDHLSYWGNQFKNGDLLDCIAFCKMMHFIMNDDIPMVLLYAVTSGWDDGKAKLFMHPFGDDDAGMEMERLCINRAQNILDTKPCIVGVIKPFVDLICENDARDNDVVAIAQATHASVHWILRRERYLAENNSIYANDPNCHNLIKAAEQMRERLLSSPYADKFDLRPPRSLNLSDKGAKPSLI